uniref:Xyloside xylosyltransferase 1 n=1 Tax=Clastoptera arizonana TaxID=38151 RepID=A0A1B6CT90_9HEMI
MRVLYKVLLNLIIFSCFLLVCYVFQINNNYLSVAYKDGNNKTQLLFFQPIQTPLRNSSESIKLSENFNLINIWLIFTKVKHKNSPLKFKLKTLISSLLRFSSMPLGLNVISDEPSKLIAEDIINATSLAYNKQIQVLFYNIANVTEQLSDLIKTMQPFFTSSPGTYYSDALFFISLGLHRIAPSNQKQAIMLDVDTMLKADIALLYKEFQK